MFIIHRSNVIYIYWKIPRTEERHFTKTFDKGVIEVPNFAPRNQTLRLFIIPTARDQKGLLKCHLFSPAMGWEEGVGSQENIKTLLQYSLLLTWSLRGKPFISFTPSEPPLGYQQQGSLTYYYTLLCKIERFNFLESQLLASSSRVYYAPSKCSKCWLYHTTLC